MLCKGQAFNVYWPWSAQGRVVCLIDLHKLHLWYLYIYIYIYIYNIIIFVCVFPIILAEMFESFKADLNSHNTSFRFIMVHKNGVLSTMVKCCGHCLCVTVTELSGHLWLQERKKAVKDAQKEKRKNKMPKHIKKRKEKVSKLKKK